jgi:hypothetical protein
VRRGKCKVKSARGKRFMASLGQNQLVLAGKAKPVDLLAVADRDFLRADEHIAAVDPMAAHRNRALAAGRGADSLAIFLFFLFIKSLSIFISFFVFF